MRLRDFSIIVIILGIATTIFTIMLTDANLETYYGTGTAHAEDNFTQISEALERAAEENRNTSVDLQNRVQDESDTTLFSIGADTFNVIKSALSFRYLDTLSEAFTQIEIQFGLPAEVGAGIFAIIVVIIVFTIVGAFLRWRT